MSSFAEFYPDYLAQHQHPICRRLHYAGTSAVLLTLALAVLQDQPRWLWLLPLLGYGPAWIGHFFFEHNRPATFRHPFYSLLGDLRMYAQMLSRLPGRLSRR